MSSKHLFYLILVHTFIAGVHNEDVPTPGLAPDENMNETLLHEEKKLSEYVMVILEHYKQEDAVGIPGAPIPDPLSIPPLAHSFSVGKMKMNNVLLYGLKKFRIHHVTANLAEMKVEAGLLIDMLTVVGNYTLSTWISSAKGPFTANMTKVYVKAIATLEIERNGQLEAQEMNMDITFKDIKMDFKGLGFFASVFQNVMNSVGKFVFDSIQPFILSEINTNIRNDVNKQVRKFPQKFPNSISPLDQLISEVRKKVRKAGYDPYKVNDYNNSVGIFDVYMSHTWVHGLSSFHRTKSIIFEIKNRTVHTLVEIGTQKLLGSSHWEISLIAGMMSKVGTVSFSIDYLRVQIAASQSMNTTKSPVLDDIQLELGNIQVRFDGLGTVDYVIEFAINVLPNLIRQQIMNALEKPIKLRIQETLNQVNIEKLIKENADKLDNANSLEFLN